MFGVETDSFLPDQQSDRCDLACQGQARHGWFHSAGDQSAIELLKWPGYGGSSGGRTLEDIFQIVIVVGVEPANRQELLRALQPGSHKVVLSAAVRLQSQTAVGPKLSLGAKTMRRLDQSDQQGPTSRRCKESDGANVVPGACGSRPASLRASMRSLLFPAFSRAFFRGSHTKIWVTWGLSVRVTRPHGYLLPRSRANC